ncbi:P21-Rho-binding domain [Popillia japonica]|uniref:P21-Rho-binding domain n=1 Tax=Popillia japonica TaxID=7064 RepID=A0AAW1IB69_POPJA
MAQKQRKQIENKPSILLSPEENQQIFRLVGSRCKTITTAVVQLYHTQSPNHIQWVKKDTGVLCFVRDNVRKTYFFRLFCLKRNCMVWEQETYTQMDYDCRCSFLHTFEGDKCIYAFNFASTHEADDAKQIITDKLARRRKSDYKNIPRKGDTMVSTNPDPFQNTDQKLLDQALKKKRKRNLTKADIGNPSEFRHVSHIGWHRDKGLDIATTDIAYQDIFKKAGIGEQDLKDRKTREFILDFIHNYSDIESIKQETRENKPVGPLPSAPSGTAVPPVPPRSAPKPPHNRAAPPPPPNCNQPPPRPAQYKIGVPPPPPGNAPSPPPPPPPLSTITNGSTSSGYAPPPPPPPPLMQDSSSLAVSNQLPPMDNSQLDMRSALMQSIRGGATLRPIDITETKSNECDRDDMLRKIREGVSLKSASEREIKAPSTPVNQVPDIATALRKALETRSNRIHSDTDTESDTSNDDEWDA